MVGGEQQTGGQDIFSVSCAVWCCLVLSVVVVNSLIERNDKSACSSMVGSAPQTGGFELRTGCQLGHLLLFVPFLSRVDFFAR